MVQFEEMKNEIIAEISGGVGSERMIFTTEEGDKYELYHNQD
jgi:hypothetical protein